MNCKSFGSLSCFSFICLLGSSVWASNMDKLCNGDRDPLNSVQGVFSEVPSGQMKLDLASRKQELIRRFGGHKEDLIYLRQKRGQANDALNIFKEGLHLENENPLALSLENSQLQIRIAGSLFIDGKKNGGLSYAIDVLERSPQRSGQGPGNPRYLVTVFGGNKVQHQLLINTNLIRMMARVCGRDLTSGATNKNWQWIVNYVR
jgi:hypothetical protein